MIPRLILNLLLALLLQPPPGMAAEAGLPHDYWQRPIPAQGAAPPSWPYPQGSLLPDSCGSCHVEQFEDWSDSLHAHAVSPGLVGQFPTLGQDAQGCLNCHAPLSEQALPNRPDWPQQLGRFAGDPERTELPHAGVACAACHVRGNNRFGPPRRDEPRTGKTASGWIDGGAHGGFTVTPAFENSEFCAACHQFPASMAINGKPLENTLAEWRASRFAREGTSCQGCHMPDRRHLFKGIHDPDTVRGGLDLAVAATSQKATLTLTSTGIGHQFPTYVTPAVHVLAVALDDSGGEVGRWRWTIQRRIEAESGQWQERRDTRIAPGERRLFEAAPLPLVTTSVRFSVTVEPDAFYKGVYRGMLEGELLPLARGLIQAALTRAEGGDYLLWQRSVAIPRSPGPNTRPAAP